MCTGPVLMSAINMEPILTAAFNGAYGTIFYVTIL